MSRGKVYNKFTRLNSFGYYLSHDGVFYGYAHGIGPDGPAASATFQPIEAGRLFDIRVPEEGRVRIKSGISAEEWPAWFTDAEQRACDRWSWTCVEQYDPEPERCEGWWCWF